MPHGPSEDQGSFKADTNGHNGSHAQHHDHHDHHDAHHGHEHSHGQGHGSLAALTLGSIAGHAGLPAVSVPLASLDGCPLGLCLVAGPGEDERLLALAASLPVRAPAAR